MKTIDVDGNEPATSIEGAAIAVRKDSVTVVARKDDGRILSADPAQQDYGRHETLDANPRRAGVPISIPGEPAETASGGIKAPQ